MNNAFYYTVDVDLTHHGIKGQKWGVRRYQNKDGSLTAAGKKRYDFDIENTKKKMLYSDRKSISQSGDLHWKKSVKPRECLMKKRRHMLISENELKSL